MPTKRIKPPVFFLLAGLLLIAGCGRLPAPAPADPDLVIFTSQEEAVYEPIIKEYQERSGLNIRIISGTSRDLQEQLREDTLSGYCDVVFGISASTLEYHQDRWEPYTCRSAAALIPAFTASASGWTPFSAASLVIIYNTRVVTYRELPTGWQSLLEPRWKGRIAYMNPETSDICSAALAAAMHTSEQPLEYLADLAANLDYRTFDSLDAVTQAVTDGRCSIGVTLEETAELLRREGADVDYISPESGGCFYLNGSAVVENCRNPEAARSFIDFTVGSDAQYILTDSLNRRPVRGDIAPPAGLTPLSRPASRPLDAAQIEQTRTTALTVWRQLFEAHLDERR